MSILEMLGVFFLVILVINILIGIWAIRTALFSNKEVRAQYRN